MKLVKIELNQVNNYSYKESNDDSLKLLAFFLTDDCGCSRVNRWIDWLRNPNATDSGGNYTWIEKEENNIIISAQYTDEPYEWTFESTIDDLIYILQEWQKLCSAKKREIIITHDNGKFTIEGHD